MRNFIHKKLADGSWFKLSLPEQLANIGSEINRVVKSRDKDKETFWKAVERTLELFDLTLEDERWKERKREIARARELFCDAFYGGKEYGSKFEDLNRYFLQFAFLARLGV